VESRRGSVGVGATGASPAGRMCGKRHREAVQAAAVSLFIML
jgi:hypothetical protein